MSADPGFGPQKKTLGETLFPKESIENKFRGGTPAFFIKVWESHSTLEIEDLLFFLKRPTGTENVRYVAFCLEKVFNGLADQRLVERIAEWFPCASTNVDWNNFAKEARESIGKLALEVFFEVIFDRNKEGLWKYLSQPTNFSWERDRSCGLHHYPSPKSLIVFIDFLSRCNSKTKEGYKNQIRKFLQHVINEPLTPYGIPGSGSAGVLQKIGINDDWRPQDRIILANALVMNGMYEECLGIEEAYYPLVLKFVEGLKESKDGLVKFPLESFFSMGLTTLKEAVEKACEDRELGHMLGVIVRHAIKYKRAKVANTFDPTNPSGFVSDKTVQGIQTHMAILWNNPALQVGI